MGYRRGFKTEAHALAEEIRGELGLRPLDPLDPHTLAQHLEIPVLPLSDFAADAPYALHHFSTQDTECFSAATIFRGSRRLIVHNDSHSLGRQHSNLGHELSHGLLLHPATPAIDDRGCRHWNPDVEDEAAFLGAALLVSEFACLEIARRGLDFGIAAERYGVTVSLLRWRVNITGAQKRAGRRPSRAPLSIDGSH